MTNNEPAALNSSSTNAKAPNDRHAPGANINRLVKITFTIACTFFLYFFCDDILWL